MSEQPDPNTLDYRGLVAIAKPQPTDPTAVCPRCGGTGTVLDDRIVGRDWRNKREARGVSLRHQAGAMGYSASYVCDLELGRRRWTATLIEHYREVLEI